METGDRLDHLIILNITASWDNNSGYSRILGYFERDKWSFLILCYHSSSVASIFNFTVWPQVDVITAFQYIILTSDWRKVTERKKWKTEFIAIPDQYCTGPWRWATAPSWGSSPTSSPPWRSPWSSIYPRLVTIRLLHSHWSRSYITALSLVESFPSDACWFFMA